MCSQQGFQTMLTLAVGSLQYKNFTFLERPSMAQLRGREGCVTHAAGAGAMAQQLTAVDAFQRTQV